MCANLFLDELDHDYIDSLKRSWADNAKSSNENGFHLHESAPVGGTYLPVNGFARRLVLIHRQKATRKCLLSLTNWIRKHSDDFQSRQAYNPIEWLSSNGSLIWRMHGTKHSLLVILNTW